VSEIASPGQLRLSFLRWALVTVPLILLLGFASGRIVPAGDQSAWYRALTKPALNPPGIAFPVVWSLLYILLGLALAIVLNARGAAGRGLAITLFVVQLILNLVWTPLFFGAHQVTWALVDLVALVLVAILTTVQFSRVRRTAAWLMVPYLVWISFAACLTFGIRQLNPDAESLVPPGASTQIQL
jgi:benzodiazapine receptor